MRFALYDFLSLNPMLGDEVFWIISDTPIPYQDSAGKAVSIREIEESRRRPRGSLCSLHCWCSLSTLALAYLKAAHPTARYQRTEILEKTCTFNSRETQSRHVILLRSDL